MVVYLESLRLLVPIPTEDFLGKYSNRQRYDIVGPPLRSETKQPKSSVGVFFVGEKILDQTNFDKGIVYPYFRVVYAAATYGTAMKWLDSLAGVTQDKVNEYAVLHFPDADWRKDE